MVGLKDFEGLFQQKRNSSMTLEVICSILSFIKRNSIVKSGLPWSDFFVTALKLPFFIPLSQVVRLAALSSSLPFACFTVHAATEKESKGQLVKPHQVRILLLVSI